MLRFLWAIVYMQVNIEKPEHEQREEGRERQIERDGERGRKGGRDR